MVAVANPLSSVNESTTLLPLNLVGRPLLPAPHPTRAFPMRKGRRPRWNLYLRHTPADYRVCKRLAARKYGRRAVMFAQPRSLKMYAHFKVVRVTADGILYLWMSAPLTSAEAAITLVEKRRKGLREGEYLQVLGYFENGMSDGDELLRYNAGRW